MNEKREIQRQADEFHGVCGEIRDGRSVPREDVSGEMARRLRMPKMRRKEVLFHHEPKRVSVQ